ncbi:lysylphosphatidylglycerol synthase domain-containing protein [Winogradskyella endarachnes]|uniref:Flippase-like domain-containing protein n=1 Tax=Winogradskyella endarachnes TaxID=2681965 RepID=A0A6L6U934_9FLAO|nr:lysylphosphatidylglycerol synthase domain-containing protein [Winogradskyella endarachnes]MUU78698.1 hypothetical protein [Winogradskyella endarachnes]
MHYKTKQFFFLLIKLSIVVGAFYFIYSKIIENENLKFHDFVSILNKNNVFSTKNIIFLVFLSFFNWFLEILKWQNLVKTVQHISFKSATIQSLAALTTSLITPNRIGDYGAKAMYYIKTLRTKIVLLNLLGNVEQMFITTLLGCIGLYVFSVTYSLNINYYKIAYIAIIIAVIGLISLIALKQIQFKIKGFSIASIVTFIKSVSLKTHLITLILSLLRYGVFSFQFYYMLQMFGLNINYTSAMTVITSMYLLASVIPTMAILDVVVKGGIAVFLFTYLGLDELSILSITSLMWLLNFVLPSIIGGYFVLNFKLPKSVAA